MSKNVPPDQSSLAEFRAFFKQKECPICQSAARNLARFYFWFILESYYNPAMMEELKNAHGLCGDHTWRLIDAESPYITGVMYQYLTKNATAKMEEFLEKIRLLKNKTGGFLRRKRKKGDFQILKESFSCLSPCPACASLEEDTKYAITKFLRVLNEPRMKALYKTTAGLCVHHFFRVLSVSEESQAIFLLEDQIARSRNLSEELGRFLESYDYRYPKEKRGEEQNAWRRGAEFFVGKKSDPLGLLKRTKEGRKFSLWL